MKYIILFISFIFVTFYVTPAFLEQKYKKNKVRAVLYKAMGTMFSVIFGSLGVLINPSPRAYFILTGISLGLIGDIFLEVFFPIGGIAFLIGNLIYIRSMTTIIGIHTSQIILCFLLLIAIYLSLHKGLQSYPIYYRLLFLPYAIIVTFMAATAICFLYSRHGADTLLGLGTLLFAISDYMLIYRVLYNNQKSLYSISLSTYYIAQLVISSSLLLS